MATEVIAIRLDAYDPRVTVRLMGGCLVGKWINGHPYIIDPLWFPSR